jgi:hypothetical protein
MLRAMLEAMLEHGARWHALQHQHQKKKEEQPPLPAGAGSLPLRAGVGGAA